MTLRATVTYDLLHEWTPADEVWPHLTRLLRQVLESLKLFLGCVIEEYICKELQDSVVDRGY